MSDITRLIAITKKIAKPGDMAALALACGVSRVTVSRWMSGEGAAAREPRGKEAIAWLRWLKRKDATAFHLFWLESKPVTGSATKTSRPRKPAKVSDE